MNTDTPFYYELTDPDELLREGDEYFTTDEEWVKVVCFVGAPRKALTCRVRRPVTPTPSVTEPEYRMLGAHEILKPGDQVYGDDGGWVFTQHDGCRAGPHLRYRRPVASTPMGNEFRETRKQMTTLNPSDPKREAGEKKPPLHLLPVAIMEETAWVLKGGAERYGLRNYRHNKVCASTYISAIMRHLNKWREREDLDTESGRSHLAHIAANCAILLDAAQHGTLEDDRA